MSEVFISYSRKNQAFVERLVQHLETAGIDNWVDRDDIEPAADWRERIQKGIEAANNFVFVISPASVQSDECRWELEWAIQNGKRLVPIVLQDIDPRQTHPALAAINWIFCREQVEDLQSAFTRLVTAIRTDLDWTQIHSRLQTRALEWQRQQQDPSFLLRGKDLQDAEQQLAGIGPDKNPQPTELQRQYVLAGRQDATRRQRINLSAVSIALILVIGLAIIAFILRGVAANEADLRATAQIRAELSEAIAINDRDQKATAQVQAENAEATAVAERDLKATAQAEAEAAKATAIIDRDLKATAQIEAENAQAIAVVERDLKATAQVIAETQRDIAISRQLAAQSRLLMAEQMDLALLLAVEASLGTADGQLALTNLLQAEPRLVRIVSSPQGYIGRGSEAAMITSLALSPDGKQLVAKSLAGAWYWDLENHQTQELSPTLFEQYWQAWAAAQLPAPDPEMLVEILDPYLLLGPGSAVPDRVAIAACRTAPSAGGAPGCASLIYVFDPQLKRIITPLASCNLSETASDLRVELEGGLLRAWYPQTAPEEPADFELYSVALENKSSNYGSQLSAVLYDPQTHQLATAVATDRHGSQLGLIVWDLNTKGQILELFTPFWGAELAEMRFAGSGAALEVCVHGAGLQIDIDPASWRQQACEITGRNLTAIEWRQFFGDQPYRQICPQWP